MRQTPHKANPFLVKTTEGKGFNISSQRKTNRSRPRGKKKKRITKRHFLKKLIRS